MMQNPFANRSMVGSYAVETPRKVPGLADLHRMVGLLLSEQAPLASSILVVGAGGGLELRAMAEAQPAWTFTGVDPSAAMLELASDAVGAYADRVDLIEGTIDAAPGGPFDGATCLLVLHFLDRATRLRTFREIRRRLRPGARLAIAHHAPPAEGRENWMTLSAAFADRAKVDWARAAAAGNAMTERLPLLTPAEEEDVLREAGFTEIALFYAALSFRGWVARA